MKPYIIILILATSVCFSCRQPYDPKIDSVTNALVVEGMITDEAKSYTVKLSLAVKYDSTDNFSSVNHAHVSILDDCGNKYNLLESGNGVYASNPAELKGLPGHSYTLHIETQDGEVYESSPQTLLLNDFGMTTHAAYTTQDKLIEDAYGQVSKITVNGVDLLANIANNTDTISRFRFESVVTTEYMYSMMISPTRTDVYYCWYSENPDNLVNLTDEKYQTSSYDIQNHTVCFIPTVYMYPVDYVDSVTRKDSLLNASIANRIIRVTRYRMNNESFQYYKDINSLLSAQGKIFDPTAYQFKGNITCISNPQKLALGLFEASSVRTSIYTIKPGSIKVNQISSFNLPSPSGCVGVISSLEPPSSGGPPDFWVY